MSRHKPKSFLSALFNTMAAPAYRLEYHVNLNATIQRFNIDALQPNATRRALLQMESGLFEIRDSSDEVKVKNPRDNPIDKERYRKGNVDLAESGAFLFNLLRGELTALVMDPARKELPLAKELDPHSNGNSASGFGPVELREGAVIIKPGGLLLEYAYYFFHFRSARNALMGRLKVVEDAVNSILAQASTAISGDAVEGALRRLHDEMNSDSPNSVAVRTEVAVLCEALEKEYSVQGCFFMW